MHQYHLTNRPNREITSPQEIAEILKRNKFVVIAMCRNNEPYIVTLSYGYDSDNYALYFHAAKAGLKLDFMTQNPHVCATVIEDGGYVPNECAHEFRSVVFWGNMVTVHSLDEKKRGMAILLNHLEENPSVIADKMQKSEAFYEKMEVLRLDIAQIHGKAGR